MRSFARIVTFAFQGTFRNFWLSFVTTSVFLLTLLTVNSLIALNVLADGAVRSLESRVRIDVYLTSNASEDIIKSARGYLLGMPQVKTIDVIPEDEALAAFREKHHDDPQVLAALDEVGGNPIGNALRISANDAADFPYIIEALNSPEFSPYIKDSNFSDSTSAIEKLSEFTSRVRVAGLALAIFFAFISILIVLNTIRVAIYVHREEIGIMKLVGATDWFVRGPFLLEVVFFAAGATLLMAGATYLALSAAETQIAAFFVGVDVSVLDYFVQNGFAIFGLQFVALVVLGVATTWFAMRRYLRV
ncbi:MAG: ABC transporter permease [Candidatus Uhrbacteria bacterium]|nr:ABC transporter permease [Candidatus Uhrbacteria bacterium]